MYFRRLAPVLAISHLLELYFGSVQGNVLFALHSAASVALAAHKIVVVLLHRPLSMFGLIVHAPFLFSFDILALILLHHAFMSPKKASNCIGVLVGLIIISWSAMFISSYLETNTELNWGRSVEVNPPNECLTTLRLC